MPTSTWRTNLQFEDKITPFKHNEVFIGTKAECTIPQVATSSMMCLHVPFPDKLCEVQYGHDFHLARGSRAPPAIEVNLGPASAGTTSRVLRQSLRFLITLPVDLALLGRASLWRERRRKLESPTSGPTTLLIRCDVWR